MINILLGFLIIVAVILAIWSIQIKRKHGGGCGGCGIESMEYHDVKTACDLLSEAVGELCEIIKLLILGAVFELVVDTSLIYHLQGSDGD